jgi:hypothetical protein
MNGDVQFDLTGGTVSFDTLYRLDQLTATLTGHLGWRVSVEIDPGITLTATPAREFDALVQEPHAPERVCSTRQAPEQGKNVQPPQPTNPEPPDGRTA